MAKSNGNKLTDNQIKFCEEYLIHGNGTLAYKTAYPAVVKDSTAAAAAARLLRNVNIQAQLDKRKAEIAAKLEITPEKTLKAYAERAYFDPRQLVDPETGCLIPLHRLPQHVAAGVTKIKARQLKPVARENNETGDTEFLEQSIIEVEWDKGDSSRDALAKFQGLFGEDNKQKQANVEVYNQVRAEIEKEMVEDTFEKIAQQNKDKDPDVPDLTA